MSTKNYPSHSWLKAANRHYENTIPYCINSSFANSLFFIGAGIGMTLGLYPTTMISGTLTIAVLVGSMTGVVGGIITRQLGPLSIGLTVMSAIGAALYKYGEEQNQDNVYSHNVPSESTIGVMKEGFLYGWDKIIGESMHYTLDPAKYVVETVVDHFIDSITTHDD